MTYNDLHQFINSLRFMLYKKDKHPQKPFDSQVSHNRQSIRKKAFGQKTCPQKASKAF